MLTIAPLPRSRAGAKARAKNGGQKKFQLKSPVPFFDVAVEAAEPFLGRSLGRHAGVVDERVQRAVEKLSGLGDEVIEIGGIGEGGGDVMGPVRGALAFGRHRVPRAGDDPRAGVAEALDRGVADAAAGAGQQQDSAPTAHRAATRRGKFARGSSIPSGSCWMMISACGQAGRRFRAAPSETS